MRRVATIVCSALWLVTPMSAQTPAPVTPVIVTQGEATVKRAPDRAWITVATETRDARAAEARQRNAEAMVTVQAALKGAGMPADAIRTTGFAVSPEYDWNDGRSILRGYVVRNQVEVRIDDLDRLSAVLDAVNAPRQVAISVQGPRFGLKDAQAARNDALRLAVADALSRAEAIASGARRTVGPIVRIDEHAQGGMPPPMPVALRMGAAQAEASTPVTPGEIDIQARVTLTVEIR